MPRACKKVISVSSQYGGTPFVLPNPVFGHQNPLQGPTLILVKEVENVEKEVENVEKEVENVEKEEGSRNEGSFIPLGLRGG
jgi:hypothetical protein